MLHKQTEPPKCKNEISKKLHITYKPAVCTLLLMVSTMTFTPCLAQSHGSMRLGTLATIPRWGAGNKHAWPALETWRKGTGLWQIWMENHPRAISIWICPHNLSDQGVRQHVKTFCHIHIYIKATKRNLFQILEMKGSQHGKYLSEIIPQNSGVIYSPHELGLQWTDLVTLKYLLV